MRVVILISTGRIAVFYWYHFNNAAGRALSCYTSAAAISGRCLVAPAIQLGKKETMQINLHFQFSLNFEIARICVL